VLGPVSQVRLGIVNSEAKKDLDNNTCAESSGRVTGQR
jgi:hypothetical protein